MTFRTWMSDDRIYITDECTIKRVPYYPEPWSDYKWLKMQMDYGITKYAKGVPNNLIFHFIQTIWGRCE